MLFSSSQLDITPRSWELHWRERGWRKNHGGICTWEKEVKGQRIRYNSDVSVHMASDTRPWDLHQRESSWWPEIRPICPIRKDCQSHHQVLIIIGGNLLVIDFLDSSLTRTTLAYIELTPKYVRGRTPQDATVELVRTYALLPNLVQNGIQHCRFTKHMLKEVHSWSHIMSGKNILEHHTRTRRCLFCVECCPKLYPEDSQNIFWRRYTVPKIF